MAEVSPVRGRFRGDFSIFNFQLSTFNFQLCFCVSKSRVTNVTNVTNVTKRPQSLSSPSLVFVIIFNFRM